MPPKSPFWALKKPFLGWKINKIVHFPPIYIQEGSHYLWPPSIMLQWRAKGPLWAQLRGPMTPSGTPIGLLWDSYRVRF